LELIFSGSEPILSKASLKPKERRPLEKLGLISVVPAGKRAKKIILEDEAWATASRELPRSFLKSGAKGSTKNATPLVRAMLPKLATHLASRELSLADFTRATPKPIPSASKQPASERELVRSAYLEHTGGALGVRVRIRDLRAATDLSRTSFDRALRALYDEGVAKLVAFDNPREKTPNDERDAVDISDVKRHVVYLEA
jgi:DNA-binding transcriptional ArsR family regulator